MRGIMIALSFVSVAGCNAVDRDRSEMPSKPPGSAIAATELEQRARVSTATQSAFFQSDYAKLEEASRAYRTEKSRTSSGLWNLTLFYAGIQEAIEAQTQGKEIEPAFRALDETVATWVRQYPESPSAHIAYSMVLLEHAWAYRGGGYASTVRPEAWAPFMKHVELARENLEKHKQVAAVDPRWYETMLTVARAQNWERSQFDCLLDEALTREPLFYQTYFLALEYLLPKWHGTTEDIEAFAQDATRRTARYEGKGMYARIYWFASQTQFADNIFGGSLANWSRMRDGFDDVIARYPDAWNVNNYAKFACLAQDKAKTRELLTRIAATPIQEAWSPGLLRACSAWAFKQ